MIEIVTESRLGATVVLQHEHWAVLRQVVVTLRGGEEVAGHIDAAMRSAPAWGPFRVRLTMAQLNLLEAAYARVC